MKRSAILIFLTLFIGFWSCNKDDEVKTIDLTVSVVYPDLYAEDNAVGVSVEITSMESQKKTTLETSAEGSVTFPDLIPGTYNIVANMTLTPEQAEVLTGIAQEIVLSGNLTNVMVAGSNPVNVTIQLIGSKAGNLLLKEIYYTGSRTPSDGAYFLDQFYEIYNNSTETIYADSLVLANCMPGNANKSILVGVMIRTMYTLEVYGGYLAPGKITQWNQERALSSQRMAPTIERTQMAILTVLIPDRSLTLKPILTEKTPVMLIIPVCPTWKCSIIMLDTTFFLQWEDLALLFSR